ncbi:MAG: ribosome small subunit-dependent GTPase A [Propionibacteriaceae bacterium]|jgi:ribosome biogenesis GTPase|nr:ribosome small subunit-dependent GTPase A [Propionibacteriaceae bacterium]
MSPRVHGRRGDDFDDDDLSVFDRRSGYSHPRTKNHPDYSSNVTGRVLRVDRGRFEVLLDERILKAMKARALGRKSVIVGDLVHLAGDLSGADDALARIVQVSQRVTILRRSADDDDPFERPIVANADQLLVVTALADPSPRPGMIDRILMAAYDAHIAPVLCLTKADLASPDALITQYCALGIPIVSVYPGCDLSELRQLLADHRTVFIGHSGVGKSTLINALIPGSNQTTGDVNEVTGRGRHTSTAAVALPLPDGVGWVIDTPGVRSFGLSHVSIATVLAAFPDLSLIAARCPKGCTHALVTPGCALSEAVSAGILNETRLVSLRRILTALPN